ncbi:four helix bundle protein [Danxiaibacter flavus]|uniref:Four helix bundle protein n=1 Tax=Danxiaibacter flavus TaxID=3049108 RepID=A0ABV3ZG23_9BACT|nr:four helix bundle protein [Chitinophagaceae bacterium DXS]
MDAEELKKRTRKLAVDVAHLILKLENNLINRSYSNQIIRCSSSVAANYRAARRAKSRPDFINKLKIVEEELDETLFFLDLLNEFNAHFKTEIDAIMAEGETLLRIFVATINSARK